MPILTVSQFRSLSGVTDDPPSDSDIQMALTRYEAVIEGYCQRSFSRQERTERYWVDADPIVLNNRPVAEITSVKVGTQEYLVADFNQLLSAGLLWHDGRLSGQYADVTYSAGYVDAPMDVKVVLANLVKGYLEGTFGGAVELARVKAETVYGVSRTEYEVNTTAAAAASAYAELGPFTTILDRYIEVSFA